MDILWLLAFVPLAACAAYGLVMTDIVALIVKATARLERRQRLAVRAVAIPLALVLLLAVTMVVAPQVLPVPSPD